MYKNAKNVIVLKTTTTIFQIGHLDSRTSHYFFRITQIDCYSFFRLYSYLILHVNRRISFHKDFLLRFYIEKLVIAFYCTIFVFAGGSFKDVKFILSIFLKCSSSFLMLAFPIYLSIMINNSS